MQVDVKGDENKWLSGGLAADKQLFKQKYFILTGLIKKAESLVCTFAL